MRLSCNGCRVLRKGCTPDCPIRECLLWIPSPQSQSNATLFLAKFYGRAGLLNLLNSGGDPRLRPSIFKSLLYDACGRIVNPIFGSSGLLSSGSWHLCQAAVQAVLRGDPITQLSPHSSSPLLKSCDIRHVDDKKKGTSLLKVKNGGRFKRAGAKPKAFAPEAEPVGPETTAHSGSELDGSSGLSEHSSTVETAEPSRAEAEGREGLELELTMWWGQQGKGKGGINGSDDDTCRVMLESD